MDLDRLLIREVKNHRVLYDANHSKYKDYEFKQKIWIEIGRKLIGGEDDTTSVNALKVRWKSLRDAYVKERKNDIARSCGATVKKKKPWMLKKQMEFLAPFIQNRKEFTLEASVKEDEDRVYNGDSNDMNLDKYDFSNSNVCKSVDEPGNSSSHESSSFHCDTVQIEDEGTEIEVFFRGICDAVKGLNQKNQVLVQKEIASLVMNYKLQELEEEDLHHP